MQNIVKICDDSRSEAEATAKVSGTTPHKKKICRDLFGRVYREIKEFKESKDKEH